MPVIQAEPVSRSSAEFPVYNPERADAVQRRHDLLGEFLRLRGADALLLQRPSNIAWLTCGADVLRPGTCQSTATIFLTAEARVALTNNVDSACLFDGPLCGLGFQIKERQWHERRDLLACDLCRGRKVVTDTPLAGTELVEGELSQFRSRLDHIEEPLLRELGRDLTHAVEATCRTCAEGSTEAELAGQILHRLAHHQITAVRVQVLSDGRGQRYRHWGYADAPIRRFATVSVVGRRHGLHLGLTRTVAFGEPPAEVQRAHHLAAIVLGTAFFFSQSGWTVDETWNRVARIYEKFGAADEWRLADQGELTGYEACEQPVMPGCTMRWQVGQPVVWRPTVGPAAAGDSLLIQPEGQVCLTRSPQWPVLTISVKGTAIDLPGILVREATDAWVVG